MQWTKLAADSIRHHLPKAEIILSTWQEVDSKFITYDKLIVQYRTTTYQKFATRCKS
jgi:hypothetical protein